MSPYLNGTYDSAYFPLEQTRSHFRALKGSGTLSVGLDSPDFQEHASYVTFTAQTHEILFPCPFQQTELISVLKGIEGCWAACIADLRYGKQDRKIEIHLDHSARYLLGSYLFTIDGLAKGDQGVMQKLKDTDLKQAQSIPYRRSSTNVYATERSGEYFHLHGSLDASTALNMVGMEAYRPDLTEYYDIISAIEGAVKNFTVEELEEINAKHTQAGTTVNKRKLS
jgi:hypothetical protein